MLVFNYSRQANSFRRKQVKQVGLCDSKGIANFCSVMDSGRAKRLQLAVLPALQRNCNARKEAFWLT
jgi:hypothetical protein